MVSEFAFLSLNPGEIWVGKGPFERLDSPPTNGVAFYINNFFLEESHPWFVPQKTYQVKSLEELGFLPTKVESDLVWEKSRVRKFASIFEESKSKLATDELLKLVLMSIEQTKIKGNPLALLARFEKHVNFNSQQLYGYINLQKSQGFWGATPEKLFELEGGKLEVTALAGTAQIHEKEEFSLDSKEIREHELVVQYLLEKLTKWGNVYRFPRTIRQVQNLVHFYSKLVLSFEETTEVDQLLKALHPTPALGILPTDQLDYLRKCRKELGCPKGFGAPFGISNQQKISFSIRIRGVLWDQNQLKLPVGCGIIKESLYKNEWQELLLKAQAIKKMFDE